MEEGLTGRVIRTLEDCEPDHIVCSPLGAELVAAVLALENINLNSGVCGIQWSSNSVAFKCRDCETDPTCAICVECFFNSNHKGHSTEMIFSGGGYCDCGDSSSWAEGGSCTSHKCIDHAAYVEFVETERRHLADPSIEAAINDYLSRFGDTIKRLWTIHLEDFGTSTNILYRNTVATMGNSMELLIDLRGKSFLMRRALETHLFPDSLLYHVFSSDCEFPLLVGSTAKLLLSLLPMLDFKQRCGAISLECMPRKYKWSTSRPPLLNEENEEVGLASLDVQLFTVNPIADEALVSGKVDALLKAFLEDVQDELNKMYIPSAGLTMFPAEYMRYATGSYARHLGMVLCYLFGSASPGVLDTFIFGSEQLPAYLALYYTINAQLRAKEHVEYERSYNQPFLIMAQLFDSLGDFFTRCQRSTEVNPSLLHRSLQYLDRPPTVGVAFHLGLLRLVFGSLPIDKVLGSIACSTGLTKKSGISLLDIKLEPAVGEFAMQLNVPIIDSMIQQIVVTLIHTFGIKSYFWRRNGQKMLEQVMKYSIHYFQLRFDTAVLIMLLFFRYQLDQTSSPLTSFVSQVLEGQLEDGERDESMSLRPNSPCGIHQQLIDSWKHLEMEDRIQQLQDITDHKTVESPLFRILTLWKLILTTCEFGVRNLELFATTSSKKPDSKSLERLGLVHAAEFVWQVASSSMPKHSPGWDLPYPVPVNVVSNYATASASNVFSVAPAGYPFITPPTIQGFPTDKTDVETVLTELKDKADGVGPAWKLLRDARGDCPMESSSEEVNAAQWRVDVASWAGKTLLVASLLEEAGVVDMSLQLLEFAAKYEFVNSEAIAKESIAVEICGWERETMEELVVLVCRVAVCAFVPLWTENSERQSPSPGAVTPKSISAAHLPKVNRLCQLLQLSLLWMKDSLTQRYIQSSLERLQSLIGTMEEVSQGTKARRGSSVSKDERAEQIRQQQAAVLQQFKNKQTEFWNSLGDESDISSEGENEQRDDQYVHCSNQTLLEALRETCPQDQRENMELYPKGTHTCVVCHEGPNNEDYLHVFVNLEQTSLLRRFVVDPVVSSESSDYGDRYYPISIPLTGSTIPEDDIPGRTGMASSCGHYAHRKCINLNSHVIKCPSCSFRCNFLLPFIPVWDLFGKEQQAFPFYWESIRAHEMNESRDAEPIVYSLKCSKEPIQYRVVGGEVWSSRGLGGPTEIAGRDSQMDARMFGLAFQIEGNTQPNVVNGTLTITARRGGILPRRIIIMEGMNDPNRPVDAQPLMQWGEDPENPVPEMAVLTLIPDSPIEEENQQPTAAQEARAVDNAPEGANEQMSGGVPPPLLNPDSNESISGTENFQDASETSMAEETNDQQPGETFESAESSSSSGSTSGESPTDNTDETEPAVQPTNEWRNNTDLENLFTNLWTTFMVGAPPSNMPLLLLRTNTEEIYGNMPQDMITSINSNNNTQEHIQRVLTYRKLNHPSDNGMKLANLISTYLSLAQRNLTPLFHATYLEIYRIGRHKPSAILDAQTSSKFVLYVHLLRNLIRIHPAVGDYVVYHSPPQAWLWPRPANVNHTQMFLLSFVRSLQDGLSMGSILKLAKLQTVMLTTTVIYNYMAQRLKLIMLENNPNSDIDLLAHDAEVFWLGGHAVSLCSIQRHLEIALRRVEEPEYLSRWKSSQSVSEEEAETVDAQVRTNSSFDSDPSPMQRSLSDAKKPRVRSFNKYPKVWRRIAATLKTERPRHLNRLRAEEHDQYLCADECLKGIEGGAQPFKMLNGAASSHSPIDRMRSDATEELFAHNRSISQWDIFALWSALSVDDDSNVRSAKRAELCSRKADLFEHAQLVWKGSCELMNLSTQEQALTASDWIAIEELVMPVLKDFLTFVFVAMTGVCKFDQSRPKFMNQLVYPSEDERLQVGYLVDELYGRVMPGGFSLEAFCRSDEFLEDFVRAVELLWYEPDSTNPAAESLVHVYPLPRLRRYSRPFERFYKSSIQAMYKLGPGLPRSFYEMVKTSYNQNCLICEKFEPKRMLLCMLCGSTVCSRREDLAYHSQMCLGAAQMYTFPFENVTLAASKIANTVLTMKEYKPIYKHEGRSGKDAELDTDLVDRIFDQIATSSTSRWL